MRPEHQGESVTEPSRRLGLQSSTGAALTLLTTPNKGDIHSQSAKLTHFKRRLQEPLPSPLPTEGDAVKKYDRVVDMPTGWKVPPTFGTVVAAQEEQTGTGSPDADEHTNLACLLRST